jgi:hypothetical protein
MRTTLAGAPMVALTFARSTLVPALEDGFENATSPTNQPAADCAFPVRSLPLIDDRNT